LRFKGKDINVFLKYNKYVQKRDILIPKISTKQISFDGETLVLESDIDIRVLPLPSKIVNFMNSDIELLLSKNHLDIIVDNKYESFVNHLKIQTIKINKIRSKNDTEKTMKRLYEKIAIYLSHEPINYQTIVTKEKVILRHNHNLNLRRFKNINKYYKAITNLSIKKQYLEDVGLGTFTTYGYFEQLKNIVSNPIKYEMNLYDKY
jgi:hypothetical protein